MSGLSSLLSLSLSLSPVFVVFSLSLYLLGSGGVDVLKFQVRVSGYV